jgi:hypothetical protein
MAGATNVFDYAHAQQFICPVVRDASRDKEGQRLETARTPYK